MLLSLLIHIFGDEFNKNNSGSGVNKNCKRVVEGSVANNWDESKFTWFCGSREPKYLEVTSIMKRATDKKVVL